MVDPCFDSLKNADAVVPRFKAWNELVVKMRIKDALIFIGMVIVQIQQVILHWKLLLLILQLLIENLNSNMLKLLCLVVVIGIEDYFTVPPVC
jgi:hypothetical protein